MTVAETPTPENPREIPRLGYVGALVVVLEFVTVKPQTVELVTTYSTIDTI